jgi:hypothetical protein
LNRGKVRKTQREQVCHGLHPAPSEGNEISTG